MDEKIQSLAKKMMISFIIIQLPYMTTWIYMICSHFSDAINENKKLHSIHYLIVDPTASFFSALNCSTNFLFYLCCGSSFKDEFDNIFKHCCRAKPVAGDTIELV
jgi:hypothetical protein